MYGLIDKDGNQLVENKYLYMDNAFDGYFIAYKEGEGLGIIDKQDKVLINFEYNGLNKIGDKQLIKAVNMDTDEEITTIFSKDMQRITTMKNVGMGVYDDYIELYNDEGEVYINNNGEIKQANELIKPEFLSNYFKTYKDNGEIYYSDERM